MKNLANCVFFSDVALSYCLDNVLGGIIKLVSAMIFMIHFLYISVIACLLNHILKVTFMLYRSVQSVQP